MEELEVLKKHFGYDGFRKGQDVLIKEILNKKDVVGIMPTGAGKSICYQVPSVILDGITIVVSPLISLMQDQVRALNEVKIPAAYINSSLTQIQQFKVLENARNELYKIIYVAPERLLTEEFINFSKSILISMITIDEAHCISQWGQDFRKSYLDIPNFIKIFDNRPIVSVFTATATENVRNDIINILELNNPEVLITGYDRKNLYFEVQTPKDKMKELERFLNENKEESGIIYCLARKTVEEVYTKLKEQGHSVGIYHARTSR